MITPRECFWAVGHQNRYIVRVFSPNWTYLITRGRLSLSCSRGVSSGLREGSVQSLRIKMEQCRNSLAGRYGKRASSSGGASPLPLFHFLFLLLDRVDELSHLRLPPGSPVGRRHGYCIRLILRLELLNMRQTLKTEVFSSDISKIQN